ncbi:hypothetical protein HGRIS_000781 [Hohenbuehelia grisea]|uniref:F-box domain-containing protein n=1 Tax=Hohenbuehelia grisea TaxID=104357 RepID=A0ABR3IPQ2_9AGAR
MSSSSSSSLMPMSPPSGYEWKPLLHSGSPLQPHKAGTPSPSIHKLPAELIADIFAICHATEAGNRRHSTTGCARVTLSHVCSRWRAVSLSMPTLWSTITIRAPRDSNIARLEAHLERSAMCPLTLHFISDHSSFSFSTYEYNVEIMKSNVAKTIIHAHRWKSVQLDLPNEYANPILDLLQSTSYPSIEILDLRIEYWPQRASDAVFKLLSTSSVIRRISWSGPAAIPPRPCWAALTHLDVGNNLSLRQLYTLLSQCRHVVELRICATRESGEGPLDDGAMITLEKLEILSVLTLEPLEDLLDRLCLPRLKQLELQYLQYPGLNPAAGRPSRAIDTFLARSKCSLEEFLIRDMGMPFEALNQLLRMPNLNTVRHLTIHYPFIDDHILATLTRRVDGEDILPQLQAFSFWHLQGNVADGALGDMVMSRCKGAGQHLERLRTEVRATDLCSRDREALDSLKMRGLDIQYGVY